MTVFENLDEKFDVEPVSIEPVSTHLITTNSDNDIEHARETLHTLINKGSEAIDGILNIAKNTDHPRAYEVAGQLIKTISDVAKDLIDVQKKKQDLEKSDTKIQTQNNVFVGSTHELMKMLKQAKVDEEK